MCQVLIIDDSICACACVVFVQLLPNKNSKGVKKHKAKKNQRLKALISTKAKKYQQLTALISDKAKKCWQPFIKNFYFKGTRQFTGQDVFLTMIGLSPLATLNI